MKSVISVSAAQAQLPKLIRSENVVGIMRRTELAAFLVPRERMEPLLETLEILADPKAVNALKKFQAGKMKFKPWKLARREFDLGA